MARQRQRHLIGLTCNAVCSARRGTSLLVRFEVHEEIEHDAAIDILPMIILIVKSLAKLAFEFREAYQLIKHIVYNKSVKHFYDDIVGCQSD